MTDSGGDAGRQRQPKTITWSPVMAEKGGYRHFMLKEIYEQPRAIADTLAGRIARGTSDGLSRGHASRR